MRESKSRAPGEVAAGVLRQARKKTGVQLAKKKMEELRTPEILIKVNYKSKRITIPIVSCDERSLHETVMPHIVRFEQEVLRTVDAK